MQIKHLKGELVRIRTKDNLELHGMFFEPEKTTKTTIIHVHGWVGNFYENRFIDFIAQEAVKNGYSFLTFNNRGAGIVTDFIRKKESRFEYIRIGGSLERFEDCIVDIKAAIDFLDHKGYQNIILQGHSTGCQKITYYKHETRNGKVKGLVELSPVDDVAVSKKLLGNRYEEALNIARKMVKEGNGNNPVPGWMAFYPLLTAKTFLSVADPESSSGRIFNYHGELKEIKNVNCPVLAIFGSKDEYQENPQEKLKILEKRMKNCTTKIFKNANHWFVGFEDKLSKLICNWIKKYML